MEWTLMFILFAPLLGFLWLLLFVAIRHVWKELVSD